MSRRRARHLADQGTGAGIRSRYGVRADVAGKTGTTQDNTDGWFILMHPQLVAGAWVGFNDNRVTLGDRWGPGAQSALPMVGDFFQQAIKAKAVDPGMRFAAPQGPAQAAPAPSQENIFGWPGGGTNGGPLPTGLQPQADNAPGADAGQLSGPPIRYVTVHVPEAEPVAAERDSQGGAPPAAALAPEPARSSRMDLPDPAGTPAPNFPLSEFPAPAARR